MYEKPRVLVIGSNESENGSVARWLTQEQYGVTTADNWTNGLRQLYSERPNALVILTDVRWSDIQLIRDLSEIPVIVVTDRATRTSLQRALDLGVEGYLVRPLEFKKLTERVSFGLRRTRGGTAPRQEFVQGNLAIDWRRFEVRLDGRLVHLGPIEFRLLSLLVQHQDEVVTYGEILTKVWGSNYDLSERRNIKQYVWYLRQKIERDPSRPRLIMTRPSVGYIFCSEAADDGEWSAASSASREAVLAS